MLGRLKYIQQNYHSLSPVLMGLRWQLKRLKGTNNLVLIKFQQNVLKQELVQFALRAFNVLILFGIKRKPEQ